MKIDLGCGYRKPDGYVGIDNRAICNPDIVCDVLQGLPFATNSIDEIRAHDFLEHVPIGKTIFVMEEIHRVLIPNGKLDVFVPSTDGRAAFCDPFHVSFWNELSFRYYMDDLHRNLYGISAKFAGSVKTRLVDPVNHIYYCQAILKAIKE